MPTRAGKSALDLLDGLEYDESRPTLCRLGGVWAGATRILGIFWFRIPGSKILGGLRCTRGTGHRLFEAACQPVLVDPILSRTRQSNPLRNGSRLRALAGLYESQSQPPHFTFIFDYQGSKSTDYHGLEVRLRKNPSIADRASTFSARYLRTGLVSDSCIR